MTWKAPLRRGFSFLSTLNEGGLAGGVDGFVEAAEGLLADAVERRGAVRLEVLARLLGEGGQPLRPERRAGPSAEESVHGGDVEAGQREELLPTGGVHVE